MASRSRHIAAAAAVLAAGAVAASSPASAEQRARAAQSLNCDALQLAVSNQSAPWSDHAGWSDPSRYSTIQLADIDGDGHDELLGRTSAGMVANRFDHATGMWVPLGPPQDVFSDQDGFNGQSHFWTIQFGNIDASPGEEMIGRAAEGLYTYVWDVASRRFVRSRYESVNGAVDDASGYSDASGYMTLELADLDSDMRDELVGRRPGPGGGMEAYDYDAGHDAWVELGAQDLNSDANHWGSADHYRTLRYADVDGIPGAEMVGRGTMGIETHTWNTDAQQWEPLRSSASPITRSWEAPDKFATIQLGDIDGDQHADLVGRGRDGIEAYFWDGDRKDWVAFGGAGLALSDDSGWQDPSLYSTILLADVIGDRRADLIARGHNGLFVSGYTDDGWTPPSQITVPSMADSGGWQLPEAYSTIQAGNVTGDGKAEIIGRSSSGIETWTWNRDRNRFVSTVTPGLPAFTADELKAYRWIGQNRFADRRTDDIRSEYDNDTYSGSYWIAAAVWLHDNRANPPAGLDVTPAVWSHVAAQLEKEFSYVEAVRTWHANIDDFLNRTFASNTLTVESVGRAMNIPSDASNDVLFDAIGLILELGSAFEGLAGPEGEAAAIVMDIVHVAIEASQLSTGKPPDIQAKVYELEEQLRAWNQRTHDGNACVRKITLANWGLLKAMGEQIDENELTWPSDLTQAMVDIGQREYEIGLWKTLSPVKWTNVASATDEAKDPCTGFNDPPDALGSYPRDEQGFVLNYAQPDWPTWDRWDFGVALFIVDGDCGKAPPELALRRIFDQPETDGTGGLGVWIGEPYCGLNGWHVPGSDRINPHCNRPGRSATTAIAHTAQATLGKRRNRRARAEIAALMRTIRSRRMPMRRRVLASLHASRRLLVRAERYRGPYFVTVASRALRAAADQLPLRRLARRTHTIRALLVGHRGDPPRMRIARGPATPERGATALRLRCPVEATGPCSGFVRVLQRGRTIGRRNFTLAAGQARMLRVALRRRARRGRATVRATTTHLSGRRTVARRRITVSGPNLRPVPGACSAVAC